MNLKPYIALFLFTFLPALSAAAGNFLCEDLASASYATIAEHQGYSFLKHSTDIRSVPGILKTGALVRARELPKEKIYSYDYTPDQVFFYMIKSDFKIDERMFMKGFSRLDAIKETGYKTETFGTNLNEVTLFFSLEAFNKGDFHISRKSSYGSFNAESDFRSTNGGSSLIEFFTKPERIGEIVFYENVPNIFLREID